MIFSSLRPELEKLHRVPPRTALGLLPNPFPPNQWQIEVANVRPNQARADTMLGPFFSSFLRRPVFLGSPMKNLKLQNFLEI
jgi:hypothetical protein